MKKTISKILVILLFLIICIPVTSNAGLQANKGGTSLRNLTADEFFERIRIMEQEGGTLGTNAQIQSGTYLDTSNNGIDCHMIKNTEWGAATMLGYSKYGSKDYNNSSKTTSGNSSGIYNMYGGYSEYVGGVYPSGTYSKKLCNSNSRYKDMYNYNSDLNYGKTGDATKAVDSLYSGYSGYNSMVSSSGPVFLRGGSTWFSYSAQDGNKTTSYTSRAVVACGENL